MQEDHVKDSVEHGVVNHEEVLIMARKLLGAGSFGKVFLETSESDVLFEPRETFHAEQVTFENFLTCQLKLPGSLRSARNWKPV